MGFEPSLVAYEFERCESGSKTDEDCAGLVVQGPGKVCCVVVYLRIMSQIENGSSQKNLNPDTSCMLINARRQRRA